MVTVFLQTRDDWNARPPTSVVRLNWAKVDKFIVHYSGANRAQSVRSIQNFCMDNKGHSDIDYNELVRGNFLYAGRGNNVGSHTLNNNSTSYGVCMIGLDGDATNDDMNVIRSRYDYACAMAGRQLRMLGHNQAPTLPPGYTDCPGSKLQNWINAGMPYINENLGDNMQRTTIDPDTGKNWIGDGIFRRELTDQERVDWNKVGVPFDGITTNIKTYGRDVATVAAPGSEIGTGLTEEQLRAIMREEIAKTRLS